MAIKLATCFILSPWNPKQITNFVFLGYRSMTLAISGFAPMLLRGLGSRFPSFASRKPFPAAGMNTIFSEI